MAAVDERKSIVRFARRARTRMALVRGVEWSLRSAFYGLCVVLVWAALQKLLAVPFQIAWAAAGLGAALVVIGGAAVFFPRIDLLEAAGAVDRQAAWKERLSTALALPGISHPMEHALLEDIRVRIHDKSPSHFFPWRAPREWKFSPLAILAIVLVLMFVPPLDLGGVLAREKERQKDKEEIKIAVEKLEQRKKELEKTEHLSERVKQAIQKIDALAKEFQQTPPPEKKDALAQLSKLADQLKDLKSDVAKSQALAEKLQKAASRDTEKLGEMGQKMKEGKFQEAAQELAKLRNALQEGKMSEADKEKIKKQMQALAEKLSKDKELSEFEKKLAKAMEGLETGKEQMMNDLQQALNGLDDAMAEDEALADALKDLENLADALAKGQHECPS